MTKKKQDTPKDTLAGEPQNLDIAESGEQPLHERLPVSIHSQYIKDFSFENPNAPGIMRGGQGKPAMEVDFSLDARKISFGADADNGKKDLYEVTLGVRITATRAAQVAFIVELEYAVLVSLGEGIASEQVHPLLMIEIPRMAFPFVRQIIADITQQAGYMPLLLTPVDFRRFYAQKFAEMNQKKERAQS